GLGRLPLFDADNPDGLLAIAAAKAQLGSTEQAIHDQDVLVDAAVDDLRFAIGADDEDRRHFALHDAAREDDIDTAAIVKHRNRPPWWRVSGQSVTIVASRLDRDDRRSGNGHTLTGR